MTTLSTKQLKAIPLLVSGMQAKDVAQEIGVTPQTICEWRSSPSFEATLNQMKQDCLRAAVDYVRASAVKAIQSLTDISLNSENDETRRKACMNILEIMGLRNSNNGDIGWSIGPVDEDEIKRENEKAERLKKLANKRERFNAIRDDHRPF